MGGGGLLTVGELSSPLEEEASSGSHPSCLAAVLLLATAAGAVLLGPLLPCASVSKPISTQSGQNQEPLGTQLSPTQV